MAQVVTIDGLDLSSVKVVESFETKGHTQVIVIDPEDLHDTIRNLQSQELQHLSTIVGLHENGNLTSYYPLSTPRTGAPFARAIHVKTTVPVDNPVMQSIEDLFPVANVYERELTDLFGIEFTGVGSRDVLLLPDDFPTGYYPLRKDMTSRELQEMLTKMNVGGSITKPLKDYSTKENGDVTDYSISVGPQHPTHKEPIRFHFFVNGENIENVDLRIGFNHRGIEKALEMNSWTQNLYLIERICGICSAAHQLAYTITAEKIAGIEDEIPERANWLRVLIAEFERIHSHILWYGVLAHDAGYDMMFHISWRDREVIMDLLEKMTGNRVNYSIQAIGVYVGIFLLNYKLKCLLN